MLIILTILGILSAALSTFLFKWYSLPLPWNVLVIIASLIVGIILWEVIYWVVLSIWSLFINKKKEVTNEIIQKASYVMFAFNFGKNLGSDNAKILNEQLKNFSPNGQVRVDASGNVLLELTFDLNR